MKISLIILVGIIFLCANLFAKSIDLDYPSKVSVEEEFPFSIKLIDFPAEKYDIKIDIVYEGRRIAKVDNNGEWKSTYYYLPEAIEDQETFYLKVVESFETASIIIKIRNSAESVDTFTGYEIAQNENDKKSEEEEDNSESEEEQEEKIEYTEEKEIEKEQEIKKELKIEETKSEEVISVPKTIKSEKNFNIENKYLTYGLIEFSILLVLLFLLEYLLKKQNEKNRNKFNI